MNNYPHSIWVENYIYKACFTYMYNVIHKCNMIRAIFINNYDTETGKILFQKLNNFSILICNGELFLSYSNAIIYNSWTALNLWYITYIHTYTLFPLEF